MIINFNILKNEKSWNVSIHQLNSDVLLRHIRMSGSVNDFDLGLSYCEKTNKGSITDSHHRTIGDFFISSY